MTLRSLGRGGAARAIVCATAAMVITAASVGHAKGVDDDRGGPDAYTIGLFGDMPYNALGKAQCPDRSYSEILVRSVWPGIDLRQIAHSMSSRAGALKVPCYRI
jgi:hypothetical protein